MTAVRRFPLFAFFVLACLVGWYPYIVNFLAGVWYVVVSRRRRLTARRLDEGAVSQYAVSS